MRQQDITPIIHRNAEGPEILKSDVKLELEKVNRKTAAGPDRIVIKMMTALDDSVIDKTRSNK